MHTYTHEKSDQKLRQRITVTSARRRNSSLSRAPGNLSLRQAVKQADSYSMAADQLS